MSDQRDTKSGFELLYWRLGECLCPKYKEDFSKDAEDWKDKLDDETRTWLKRTWILVYLSGEETENLLCQTMIMSGLFMGEEREVLEVEIVLLSIQRRAFSNLFKATVGTNWAMMRKLRWPIFLNQGAKGHLVCFWLTCASLESYLKPIIEHLESKKLMPQTVSFLKWIGERQKICMEFATSKLEEYKQSNHSLQNEKVLSSYLDYESSAIREYLYSEDPKAKPCEETIQRISSNVQTLSSFLDVKIEDPKTSDSC